jgi:SAM-dependent methyltransferase
MTPARLNPTQRFSSRVENYIKYRPTYPAAILDVLTAECQLSPEAMVADVGSGTGILTRLFLENGNRVWGIEPNQEMRQAGERLLSGHPRFTSVAGAAEKTTLADHTVDFVVAGQAFHWFDLAPAQAEFARILKPGGWVALVWNSRRSSGTPFLEAYERLLRTYGTDYTAVNEKKIDAETMQAFFAGGVFRLKTFDNHQHFDLDGVEGRLLSSSYTPEEGHPNYDPMLEMLASIFQAYQVNGQVTFEYDTQLYYGQLLPGAAGLKP